MLKVAVVGLGRFGGAVARALYREGAEVLAVDRNLRLVEAMKDEVSVAVAFDATDTANLQAYDFAGMDAVVVAIGTNFEASVLVTLHCKGLGVPLIHAKALNPMQEAVLRKVGADHVAKPEEDMGERLAGHLLHDSVVDFVELPKGYSLRRLKVPADWVGHSLADLALLSKLHLNLVQVVRNVPAQGEAAAHPKAIPLPDGSLVLEAGDLIDLIGPDGELRKYE